MSEPGPQELTELLRAWADGDHQALEQLTPHVYRELHRIARRSLAGERHNHPLQATALIHEAYIRLIDWKGVRWQSRTHFFAMSAKLMRRVLVDVARRRDQRKRGGGMAQTTIGDVVGFIPGKAPAILELESALAQLEAFDPRKAQIVELRFFAGLSIEETATALQISERTVNRDWELARSWLRLEMERSR
jgi:RNA polymerase sigma factor (TIGR02999 family)